MSNIMSEYTIPFKRKRIPFRKCEECEKRKFSTTFYEVDTVNLMSHIDYNVCRKCMKEAKERAKEEN